MRRRDLSKMLLATGAGAGLVAQSAPAQAQVACGVPSFPATALEVSRGVTPVDLSHPPGDIRRYGALGNGTSDDTTAVQTAVNLGYDVAIPVPPVAWRLTRSVVVPSDRTLRGTEGRSRFTWVSGSFAAFLLRADTRNVTFDALVGASAADSLAHPFIRMVKSSDVTVQGCRITNGRIVEARSDAPSYLAVNDGNYCRNIRVRNNWGRGARLGVPPSLEGTGAIEFAYVISGEIIGNTIDSATGIHLWGGDGEVTKDGALSNERKCSAIVVSGNRLTRCRYGIVSSMLQDSSLSGNFVDDTNHAGILLTGCFDVAVSGNVARDCPTGCFATLAYNRNVVFSGNSASTRHADWPVARIYNGGSRSDNRDVAFYGNTFRGIDTMALVDNLGGPALTVIFEGNDLINVRISFASNNSHRTRIANNSLMFEFAHREPFCALDAGNTHPDNALGPQPGNLTIRANNVVSLVRQPPGSVGIRAQQVDRSVSMIDDNYVNNWPTDIQTLWAGWNADPNVAARFLIRRNIMGSLVQTQNGPQPAPSVVLLEDNRRENGSVFPS